MQGVAEFDGCPPFLRVATTELGASAQSVIRLKLMQRHDSDPVPTRSSSPKWRWIADPG
jgi:hypothetical protein